MDTFTPEELRERALAFDNIASRTLGTSHVESVLHYQCVRDAAALRLLADLLTREPQPPSINIHMDHVHMSHVASPAFWLVWRDGGKHSSRARFETSIPEVRHAEIASAYAEAERLAKANPGVRFYVVPARDYAVAAIRPVAWGSVVADEVDSEPPS